jgi:hypothetical protein
MHTELCFRGPARQGRRAGAAKDGFTATPEGAIRVDRYFLKYRTPLLALARGECLFLSKKFRNTKNQQVIRVVYALIQCLWA